MSNNKTIVPLSLENDLDEKSPHLRGNAATSGVVRPKSRDSDQAKTMTKKKAESLGRCSHCPNIEKHIQGLELLFSKCISEPNQYAIERKRFQAEISDLRDRCTAASV